MLDRIAIKTPCTASWEEMVGDDAAVRFCCTCSKSVYDLSAMDAVDAEAFLQRHLNPEGLPGEVVDKTNPCVRLFRRPDGRILTSECGPGNRKRHARRAAAVLAAGLAATTLSVAIAERVTRPTLNEGDEVWSSLSLRDVQEEEERHEREQMYLTRENTFEFGEPAMGELAFDEPHNEPHIVWIDEAVLAMESEPESELLGTSARTEHVAAERRASRDSAILPGVVRLVTPPPPPSSRF